VLVVVGEKDDIAGGAHNLAQAIPNAQLVTVPDRDHLTVVGDQRYKDAVVKFLREA
jgi:pimeloyl-ACP methyl ester carboxylesterase